MNLLISFAAVGQKGTIRGTIFDENSGETLIGAVVAIKDAGTGTSSDLDGQFSLQLEPGSYDLLVSYVSYSPMTIEKVVVKAKETTVLNDIRLGQKSNDLIEVVITAEALRNSESAILAMKKKANVMMDGISSAQFRKIGDATAVEAAKRVTGVSIEDGKYIYVRGLGDRYTKTMLNNADIPGLDPDKNSLQMDIFPTSLIDNIMVSKNFSAEMPADFTGGLINIETKSFPEKKMFSVSIGTAYNPQMHLNDQFLSYSRSSTDFLGFDDGIRALPEGADQTKIPTPFSGANAGRVNSFVSSFNPELAARRSKSLVDYSASVSFGNQIDLKKHGDDELSGKKLGYIFSLSYKNEYKFYDEVQYGEYQRYIDPTKYEMRYATVQNGELGEQSVLLGALAGLAYKSENTKVKLNLLHVQNGESRTGKFMVDNDGEAVGQSGYIASSDNLEYNQRSLTNVLLNGTHNFRKQQLEMDWRISPTYSTSVDPDIRKTAFTLTNVDTSFIAGAGGNPSRIWRSLNEINAVAKVDFTKTYTIREKEGKLKFGASQLYKDRSYEILFFDIQFFGAQPNWTSNDASLVLQPGNLYPNSTIYYQSGNNNPNSNAYESNASNTAAYISNEFNFNSHLKTILGMRMEKYIQRHTGRDQRYSNGDLINGKNLVNQKVLDATDFFPSVNFIYSVNEDQNLRLSYSRTIARPSFKELSFAQILDPITNRIFNGTLFTYADWDGQLTETRIDNIDLRWEWYQKKGQLISLSAFYKSFDNPIELVRIPEQQTSTEFQPRNVGDGMLIGGEIELRKNLHFISPKLSSLSISGNFTYVKSKIDMTRVEYNARKVYEKEGQVIADTREMAGQSPYVLNAGVVYSNDSLAFDAGLYYNVKGKTLYIVGSGLFPDIYYEPFHSLNFSVSKKFGEEERLVLDIRVSNILNDKMETYYHSFEAEKQLFSSINPGTAFSFGLSYKFR